jgi:hypothetical protein
MSRPRNPRNRTSCAPVVWVISTVVGIVFAALTPAQAGPLQQLQTMTDAQHATLRKAFTYGEPYDLGYTLAAIAWQESHAGEVPVNISDPSFGPFHNRMDTVMKRVSLEDTSYNRNVIAAKLLNDFDFSAAMAVKELLFWRKVHHGRWRSMIRSYNAGYHYRCRAATAYVSGIIAKVNALKRAFDPDGQTQIAQWSEAPRSPAFGHAADLGWMPWGLRPVAAASDVEL